MEINAYKQNLNKQYQLISKYHSVLLTYKGVDSDVYTFTHCNSASAQTQQLPLYDTNTFYVSTINICDSSQINVVTNNWFHTNDIETRICDVNSLTADAASAYTNTQSGYDCDYIATKYFVDWQKENIRKKFNEQMEDEGLRYIGHLITDSDKLSAANYVLGVFNASIGDNSGNQDKPITFDFGDVKQTYVMGSDSNNIQSYQTCGFVAINNDGTSMKNIYNNDVERIISLIGFRKQYIVKIDEMLKEEE